MRFKALDHEEQEFLKLVLSKPGKYLANESFKWEQTTHGTKAKALWVKPLEMGLICFDHFYRWKPTDKLLTYDV